MTFLPHSYDRAMVRQILSVGLPLGLNSALYSVGHLVMQTLFNTQGSAFVAGCSVAGKVNAIANIAITSFSSAATIFAGQNLGAEDYRRLRRGALIIPVFSGAITLAAGLLLTAAAVRCSVFLQGMNRFLRWQFTIFAWFCHLPGAMRYLMGLSAL